MRIDTHDIPATIAAYPLEFTGSGGEFFRVWIVNVLLSIVTFGFYTPFARRRTAQYFYSHTLVADSPLEFTAQPRKMFFGFLLLVGLYIAFKVAEETGQETTTALMLLGIALLAPYFWGSAMRFRLNATRWRGVRLQFAARWGEIYRASWPVFAIALAWTVVGFIGAGAPEKTMPNGDKVPDLSTLWPVILGAFVLALAVTFLCAVRLEFNYKSLLVARARIGGQPGRWKPVYGDFLAIWLKTLGFLLLGTVVVATIIVGIVFVGVGGLKAGNKGAAGVLAAFAIGILSFFLMILASAPARAYREAKVFQLVWNNVGLSHIARFKCDLGTGRYVWLRVRNIVLSILTLGFWRPFALVSEYRMKAEAVTLHVKGGLDQLAGQLAREEQGLGDAIADAAGLDLVG
jgi:uncharacterized membrane protein YjgN (DUF898 family)